MFFIVSPGVLVLVLRFGEWKTAYEFDLVPWY